MECFTKTLYSRKSLCTILIRYILLVLLFQNISSSSVLNNFNYLKTFELENGNILMCSEKGVFIKEKSSGQLIPVDDTLFASDISKEDFSFLTIAQFEQGEKYIIIAYKEIIYIFTSEGYYYTKGNTNLNPQGNYYTLVPYNYITNGGSSEYYFLIGYIGDDGQSKFLISNYQFNEDKIIVPFFNTHFVFDDVNNPYVTTFAGFSCQIMKSQVYNEVLTCFLHINNILTAGSFNLDDFSLIPNSNTTSQACANPIFINSAISEDKTKALVCYLYNWQKCQCENYDINSNTFSLNSRNEELNNLICRNEHSSSTILYYSEKTNEYFFGCYGYDYSLLLVKFNSDFEVENLIKSGEYVYSRSQHCTSLSIINSINSNDYSILIGCENSGVLYKDDLPEGIAPPSQKHVTQIALKTNTNIQSDNLKKEITTIITTINQEVKAEPTTILQQVINDSTQTKIKPSTELINVSTEKDVGTTSILEQSTDNKKITDKLIKTSELKESEKLTELKEYKYSSTYPTTYREINQTCSEEFLYQNIETKECLNYCSSEDLKNKKCIINKVSNSNIDEITQNIRNIMQQENITSDTNIVIEGGNTIYQLISSEKMSDNENTNMSVIDLGDCEKKLLEEYHLDYLLILKIDTKLNENTAVIFNYEVYNPYTNNKLNLSICSDMKIYTYSSYYPSEESMAKIKQLSESGYDLYDLNNEFYQDICSSFTSENGTDILLSDRKNDFYENISLCENDCTYKGYDLEKKRVQCECPVKEEITMEQSESKNILEDFFDGSNFSNIKLLKCFKLVFSSKGQKNNKGSIIFLCIIFSLIVLGIVYGVNQKEFIVRNITKINNEKYKENLKSNKNLSKFSEKNKKKNSFPPKKQKNKLKKKKNLVIFNYVNNNNNNNMTNSITNFKGNTLSKKPNNIYKNTEKNEFESKKEEAVNYDKYNFIDEELNSLPYDLAFNYDKRTYFQYYASLLKQKHLIIFTFCNSKDYNVFVLKLSLLLTSFAIYFAVNALFFNDDTMHDIYEQSGNAGIISQISNIFYSTIISCLINIIVKNLGLSYKDMVKIKQIPNEFETLRQSTLLIKKLKIKFAIFFCLNFILVSFFWYFISAFCAVYKNTQKILIENTLFSFFLSLLYPFGLNLIPGILRIPSLKNNSGCSRCIYFISKLIAII